MKLFARLTALLITVTTLGACTTDQGEVVLEPAPEASLELGLRGPHGVERQTRRWRVRVEDRVDVDVFIPLDARQRHLDGAHPVALVIQGGAVEHTRYAWIAEHLASRGFIAVLPDHSLDLAFFEQGNGADVVARLERDPELGALVSPRPGAVIGHSLGGVVASNTWLRSPERFSHLVLLASIPAASYDFEARPRHDDHVILSMTGELDGRIAPDEVIAGIEQMSSAPAQLHGAVIDGMNHMQWASDYTDAELENDLAPTITDEEARFKGLFLLDAALHPLIAPGTPSVLDEPMLWPVGALTTRAWEAREASR